MKMLYGHVVVGVAAGGWHSTFVTNHGRMYSCGDNRYGQLCQGNTEGTLVPRLCVGPSNGEAVTEAACGMFHTVMLSVSKCVWTAGWNHYGQLGVTFLEGDHSPVPRPLMSFRSAKPCKVRCGSFHSMFITEGGDLWTWGRGDSGQLGHGTTKNEPVPKIVEHFASKMWVSDAAGGDSHTIVCVDTGGTWGLQEMSNYKNFQRRVTCGLC